MEAPNTDIYNHDNDLDVMHKINSIELDNWINHLKYIKKEIQNLIGLYGNELTEKLDDQSVLEKFRKKEAENANLLEALHSYVGARGKIRECEDMQCDMVFINEHESYRHSYLYHLDKYRRLKDEFFSKVQGKFSLIRNIS